MRTILYDPPEIEYLDGHPYPKVSPKRTHALVQKALLVIVDRCGAGRGQAGAEWRFHVGDVDGTRTELIPDVSFVSYERLRTLGNDDREEPPFAPDVAAEVRSPSHRAALNQKKIAKYLATGSVLVLDVDPAMRRITVHTADEIRELAENSSFEHPAVPWLEFDVAALFAELDLPK